jgi:acyl carrier protein
VVLAIAASALGRERLESSATFAELGGDSLIATQILARVWQALDLRFPLSSLAPDTEVGSFVALVVEKARRHRGGKQRGGPPPRLARSEPEPLTPGQMAIWLATEVAGSEGKAVNTIPLTLRLSGRLNTDCLCAALDALVKRHDALAFEIIEWSGGLRQARRPVGVSELPIVESSAASVIERAQAHLQRPLDPTKPPLLRPLLLRVAEGEHLLALAIHHIACDAWSVKVLLRELASLYDLALSGEPLELPSDPLPFFDFSRWQRDRLARDQDELLDYWRAALDPLPPARWLPTDFPRPERRTGKGAAEHFEIGPFLLSELRVFAGEQGVTPFMVLLTAYALVLAEHSGSTDLIIGSPMANRVHPSLDGTVGYVSNTVPIRLDLSRDPSVRELLRRVRKSCLDAYDHQALPLPRLLGELAGRRDPAVPPVFQVCLVLNEMPAVPMRGLQVKEVVIHNGTSPYDLTFYLEQRSDSWVGYVEYPVDLFCPATARGLRRRLEQVLMAMFDAPDCPALGLPPNRSASR